MMMDGYFNEYVPMIEYHLLNIQYTIQTDPNQWATLASVSAYTVDWPRCARCVRLSNQVMHVNQLMGARD